MYCRSNPQRQARARPAIDHPLMIRAKAPNRAAFSIYGAGEIHPPRQHGAKIGTSGGKFPETGREAHRIRAYKFFTGTKDLSLRMGLLPESVGGAHLLVGGAPWPRAPLPVLGGGRRTQPPARTRAGR